MRVRYGDDSRRVWFTHGRERPVRGAQPGRPVAGRPCCSSRCAAERRCDWQTRSPPTDETSCGEIQDIFTTWYPDPDDPGAIRSHLRPTNRAHRRWSRVLRPSSAAAATATCFTGGVDSFYSLEKHTGSVGGAASTGSASTSRGARSRRRTRVEGTLLADVAAEPDTAAAHRRHQHQAAAPAGSSTGAPSHTGRPWSASAPSSRHWSRPLLRAGDTLLRRPGPLGVASADRPALVDPATPRRARRRRGQPGGQDRPARRRPGRPAQPPGLLRRLRVRHQLRHGA